MAPTLPTSEKLALLRRRAEAIDALRASLRRRGYLEVETPAVTVCPGVDRHLQAFAVDFVPAGGGPSLRRYLTTSPEYHMKRLLAAGSGPVFQVGRAFRNGEVSERHNPEFTIAEWYRPGWGYGELMDEVEDLVRELARALRPTAPPPRAFPRTTVAAAFEGAVGADPHGGDPAPLRDAAEAAGIGVPAGAEGDADALYCWIMAAAVEPALPEGGAFLVDYPARHAALSRVRPGDPPVAERFELFLDGIEIANGFTELTDEAEQRVRIHAENAARVAAGLEPYPTDERFLAALARGLPPCAGVALGVDRLVAWLLGVPRVQDVIAFPFE